MNKSRIICIVNDYSSQLKNIDCGGSEKSAESLAIGLHRNNYEVFVICPKRLYPAEYPFPVIETTESPVKNGGNSQKYYEECVGLANQLAPDLVIAQGFNPIMGDLKCPVIVCNNGNGDGLIGPPSDLPNIYYKFISDTQFFRCLAAQPSYRPRSFLAYTGFLDEEFVLSEHKGYFLWVASTQWGWTSKGANLFVDLAIKYPGYQFRMFGAGDKIIDAYLTSLNDKLPNFHFGGFLDKNTDKHTKEFSEAIALCQFSRLQESFGRVVPESLSKGVGVIGFRSGATQDFVEDGENGFLVENDGQLDLALKNAPFLNRPKIMEAAKAKFHVNKEIEKIISFYNSIAK